MCLPQGRPDIQSLNNPPRPMARNAAPRPLPAALPVPPSRVCGPPPEIGLPAVTGDVPSVCWESPLYSSFVFSTFLAVPTHTFSPMNVRATLSHSRSLAGLLCGIAFNL